MPWVAIGEANEVEPGEAKVYEVDDRRLAVCNTGEGIYAVADICTHDGGPLGEGRLDDHRIECPRHGGQFDVRTGRAVVLPAVRPVKTYPVRVEDGRIEVEVP